MTVSSWSIDGAEGQPIFGNTHEPEGAPIGVAFVAHGFKGYKDYGMFPAIAASCADAGLIGHRFNFSHSGMTEAIETFARADLFERDTWTRQVTDVCRLVAATAGGELAGAGLPYVLFGHSRGGVSVLLAAGRDAAGAAGGAGAREPVRPAGVATAAAPSRCNMLGPTEQQLMLDQGWLPSPSSRTGQALRVGRAFLQEQLDDPAAHDLPALVGRIRCPLLVVHGEDDPTVPASAAAEIAAAASAPVEKILVPGADHVFNTPNPMAPGAAPSPQLGALLEALCAFARRCCAAA